MKRVELLKWENKGGRVSLKGLGYREKVCFFGVFMFRVALGVFGRIYFWFRLTVIVRCLGEIGFIYIRGL